ncbi:GNAT family N-acetyltransferase [Reyranella sp. CPCC 100927]|uniref:GNAT family N-acetyltransferase n=1 Tax=Reyranella sp. CPCC 100927 TaxID=2599616 RepID=UPI0011B7CD36|nr:GNAT family N-acetyltransferase [Reyranella sp. CPCC 100927]TWT15818.1 GNAT family N-acetyltransferase [Reyranella sp. CPCC 100927]
MSDLIIRRATSQDLAAIVQLLADDELGRHREDAGPPLNARYKEAFAAIDADGNQFLAVVEEAGSVVGCLQLSFTPGLSRLGAWRGQIESVRIASTRRGGGLGRIMFEWAIAQYRERRCALVQLTTDKARPDALRFYESLGFVASHEGLKLGLD